MSEKPPTASVPAVADKPAAAPTSVPPDEKPAPPKLAVTAQKEAKPTAAKPAASEAPAAKSSNDRSKTDKSAKPAASTPPPKSSTPSKAPSQARSAVLPLGIATGVIAGLLLWLGSGNDEPPPLEPETAVQAPADTPGVPAVHAVSEPKAEQPAATVTAPPAATAEPAPTATAEPAASAATEPAPPTSASAEAAPPASATPEPAPRAAAAAPPVESLDPIPSDEGLLEGPVTQVFMAPDCAELYRKGKRVGRSGVRVRVPEGKKRVFEVVCPGHNTRKLTLDGSRQEVSIGLRPIRR